MIAQLLALFMLGKTPSCRPAASWNMDERSERVDVSDQSN